LPQVLGQHLLGGSRNKPRELTQTYRPGSHRAENMHSPFALEENVSSKCSISHVLCIEAIHVTLSTALLSFESSSLYSRRDNHGLVSTPCCGGKTVTCADCDAPSGNTTRKVSWPVMRLSLESGIDDRAHDSEQNNEQVNCPHTLAFRASCKFLC